MNNKTWTEISISLLAATPFVINIDENLFKFNSSHSKFCPITWYEVTDVTDSNGKTVSSALDYIYMGDPSVIATKLYNYYQNLIISDTSKALSGHFIHVRAHCGANASVDAIVAHIIIAEGFNFPPYFKNDLESLIIDLNSANIFLQYILPTIVDPNQHSVTVSVVEGMPAFGEFDADSNIFTFKGLKQKDLGTHEIIITLMDQKFLEVNYTLSLEVINS
jgi:hypothetical protein